MQLDQVLAVVKTHIIQMVKDFEFFQVSLHLVQELCAERLRWEFRTWDFIFNLHTHTHTQRHTWKRKKRKKRKTKCQVEKCATSTRAWKSEKKKKILSRKMRDGKAYAEKKCGVIN